MATTNGPRIILNNLDFLVDVADLNSYSGAGTVLFDLITRRQSTLNGGIGYTTSSKGELQLTSSDTYINSGIVSNYATGAFSIDLVVKPTRIEGRHFLISKNSGSFPSWFMYISGSGQTGKLWTEYRATSTTSCLVTSSQQISTGSIYEVTWVVQPSVSSSTLYINGGLDRAATGSSSGSLTSTSSLFIGSNTASLGSPLSGSFYNLKIYSRALNSTEAQNNYNATKTRFT